MKTRSGWRLRALGALAVAAGLAAAVPAEADDWNIVGLRLGMSVEETKAALKAYDPAITLDEHWQYFAYSDGVNHGLRTEDFIAYMDAYRQVISDNQWGSEGISLFFSSPPGEARLVAIDRRLDNTPNPLTSQQFREALVAKYGTPASDDGQAMRWLFPEGKVDCVINSGAYSPTQTDFLNHVF